MKSERRHELQTNALADWAGHQIEAVKPHLNLILTVLLGAIAVILAWAYFARWNASQSTAAWSDFYRAADDSEPAALLEMAKQHAGAPASVWALLLAADSQLAQGAEQAFSDRKTAETNLKQAVQTYEVVLKELREPTLRRRALFGLAEAHEVLYSVANDKKDLEAARKNYEEIARQWPNTAVGRAAQQKASVLASAATQDFLAWFSQQEPISSSTAEGGELSDPISPFDLSTLPGASELLLPDEEQTQPDAGLPDPTQPEESQPEAENQPQDGNELQSEESPANATPSGN
jgi:hypothetical protein